MIEDKRHQLDGLKLSDILSYCGCRAFTTEEYIRGANKQIANLEKENTELKNRNAELAGQKASLERWFGEAKELLKNIIRVTWGEGWNYSLDWKVKAEQFLKEE